MEKTLSPHKIDQKIVGYSVVDPAKDAARAAVAEVRIIEAKPHTRPDTVNGTTYRIKPPTMSSALYITINNITLPGGVVRPIEVFINTKNVEHAQWMTGMTRVISALLRKPGEFLFIIDELAQVYDAQGSYFEQGRIMPSVVAHLGAVLKQHCEGLGLLTKPELSKAQQVVIAEKKQAAEAAGVEMKQCSKCLEYAAIFMDGCLTCTNCGESKCQ